LLLTRKRVEVSCLEPEKSGILDKKISESLEALEFIEAALF